MMDFTYHKGGQFLAWVVIGRHGELYAETDTKQKAEKITTALNEMIQRRATNDVS